MKPEIMIWIVPVSVFAIWLVVNPESAVRFYSWMKPHTPHPDWYAQVLRVGAVVILVFIILVLSGILK